jgi:hypothetical protein
MVTSKVAAVGALVLSCSFLSVVVTGCGSGGGPDPQVEASRLETAKSMRAIFDKVHGNYEMLSPDDKAAFTKLSRGDEAKAKLAWDQMKYGPGGAPKAGSMPGAAPGGSDQFDPRKNQGTTTNGPQ